MPVFTYHIDKTFEILILSASEGMGRQKPQTLGLGKHLWIQIHGFILISHMYLWSSSLISKPLFCGSSVQGIYVCGAAHWNVMGNSKKWGNDPHVS